MNSKRFAVITALVSLSLLAGCDLFKSEDMVPRSELTKTTGERDILQKKVGELEARKTETVTTGLTAAVCTKMGEDIVVASVKTQCVGKPVVKYLTAKQSTAVATAKASAHARADAQVAVAPPQTHQRAPGGCIYASDGNLVLFGTTTKVRAGVEVARISDAELQSSKDQAIKSLISQHPQGFETDAAHISMCAAWSKIAAQKVQDPKGMRVNNDTRRTS